MICFPYSLFFFDLFELTWIPFPSDRIIYLYVERCNNEVMGFATFHGKGWCCIYLHKWRYCNLVYSIYIWFESTCRVSSVYSCASDKGQPLFNHRTLHYDKWSASMASYPSPLSCALTNSGHLCQSLPYSRPHCTLEKKNQKEHCLQILYTSCISLRTQIQIVGFGLIISSENHYYISSLFSRKISFLGDVSLKFFRILLFRGLFKRR